MERRRRGEALYTFRVSDKLVIGVDLGGTNVRARAYRSDGSPASERFENPSMAQAGTENILKQIALTVQEAQKSADGEVAVFGMAVPGHIDNAAGVVRWAPNFGETVDGVFHNWTDMQLRQPLEQQTGLKMVMDNDANLAALGEYKFGLGQDKAKCLVMLTIGTGIGGGVIMAPQTVVGEARGTLMLVGGNKGGAELGHTVIQANGLDCNAGEYGAIEGYCQRDSIVRRAVNRLRRGRKSCMSDMVAGDFAKITPKVISDAAHQGDELATEVWAEVGFYLGIGIGNFINIFAPDVVAIGGQIAKVGEPLMGPARKSAENVAIPSLFRDVQTISVAQQIEDAGLLGSAALAIQSLGASPG